jgi:hypothetical protein
MTDRVNGCFVVFEKDHRTDDIESTIEAIKHIRGVLSVGVNIVDGNTMIAKDRARYELRQKLWEVLK